MPHLALITKIIQIDPELQSLFNTHLADNEGEFLPYVFLGELTLWLNKMYSDNEKDLKVRELVKRITGIMEEDFIHGDNSTQELIAVSFVENLPSTGQAGASIRQFLGPILEEQYRLLNW